MTGMTFFILIVCVIALLFLVINFIFAPHNPYQEKYSIFECGFHSFLGQNRTQFGVKFFIFALVYLLLDLEILLIFPFALSGYINNLYGLLVALVFIGIITIGFIFELGKSALKIDSKQTQLIENVKPNSRTEYLGITKSLFTLIKRDRSLLTPINKRPFSTNRKRIIIKDLKT
jgi:NADH-ubiquinone oxidoreductase chain 3